MDWTNVALAALPLVGVALGAFVTGWMTSRRETKARTAEQQRQEAERRLDAFSALLVELPRTATRYTEFKEARISGTFLATQLAEASTRAELLSKPAEASEIRRALASYHSSYYEDLDQTTDDIIRIYRSR